MKTTIVEIIPARPETRSERTVVVCDICLKTTGNMVDHQAVCAICGRDICGQHAHHDPEDDGDYPEHWCDDCLALWYNGFAAMMRASRERYDAEVGDLLSRWKAQSLGWR